MKKYPKIVQCDSRGQIVIPKELRSELKIDEGTGFLMYSITDEGILLKRIKPAKLSEHKAILAELNKKSSKIGMKKKNITKSVENYKKTKEGRLEII